LWTFLAADGLKSLFVLSLGRLEAVVVAYNLYLSMFSQSTQISSLPHPVLCCSVS